MAASSNLFNELAAIGLGVYIIDVAYQGNAQELLALLKEEKGYIDFVIALFVLGAIQRYAPTSKISAMFITLTLIGLFIKVDSHVNLPNALVDFANGNATIGETVKKIFGAN